jgi:hypothetical protein
MKRQTGATKRTRQSEWDGEIKPAAPWANTTPGAAGRALELPEGWTVEPVEPVEYDFAVYRAWRNTAMYLLEQFKKTGEYLEGVWEAVNAAGEIWRPHSTLEPFSHRADGLDCVCLYCLIDNIPEEL